MTGSQESLAIMVDDMFFAAKINHAASFANRLVVRIKSAEVLEALAATPPSLFILDLNSDRLDPLETIRYLKTNNDLSHVPIVAFVSHVQTELIRNAQAAGCDYVLPRSAFTQFLGEIVAGNFESIRRE